MKKTNELCCVGKCNCKWAVELKRDGNNIPIPGGIRVCASHASQVIEQRPAGKK
jgi:hypothetical protein